MPIDSDPAAPDRRAPGAKLRHLEACRDDRSQYLKTTGLEHYDFVNQSLPDLALDDIDLATALAGKPLRAPLMIAPMTGGTPEAHEIACRLARVAERCGIALGVGSQRIGIEDGARARYFAVRDAAPTTALFGNIGGGQLVKGWGAAEARQAVAMIGADALFIHLNAMQEAIQGADHDFRGLAGRIAAVCAELGAEGIPVFVREVGFGLSREAAAALVDCGVAGIDCAGAGGTSWSKVEALCAKDTRRALMGARFGEWGIPTSESIRNVRRVSERVPLIATGGLRNGTDIAKALALGADIGAMARPFLLRSDEGEEALEHFVAELVAELRICLYGVGAASLAEFKRNPGLCRRDARTAWDGQPSASADFLRR